MIFLHEGVEAFLVTYDPDTVAILEAGRDLAHLEVCREADLELLRRLIQDVRIQESQRCGPDASEGASERDPGGRHERERREEVTTIRAAPGRCARVRAAPP